MKSKQQSKKPLKKKKVIKKNLLQKKSLKKTTPQKKQTPTAKIKIVPVSAKQKIQAYILKNPEQENGEIATIFNTTKHTVGVYRNNLVTEGKLPRKPKDWRRKVIEPVVVVHEMGEEIKGKELKEKFKQIFRKKDVHTIEDLSNHFDIGIGRVKIILDQLTHEGYKFNIEDGTVHGLNIEEAVQKRKENVAIRTQSIKIKELTDALDRTNEALDNALGVKNEIDYKSHKIEWNNTLNGEAVALVQLSDWHVGKRIDKKTTNGMNEYNPTIARQRAEGITKNLLKLVHKERRDIKIDNLVINLGGDAINNFLHEGDAQQNYFSPLEEVIFAKELIGNSLKTIAENGEFQKIVLLCQRGNHPRLTKRMQANVDYKMNLESMLYWALKSDFQDQIFEWHIPESDIGYYKIGDKTIRYFHGHQVGYQGGVGGLTIPMNKKIMYYDKTIKADYDMVSHWHQFQFIHQRVSVNSCLCGWDEYAQSNGFAYEPPTQTLQLLDKKRGLTGRFPIFCE